MLNSLIEKNFYGLYFQRYFGHLKIQDWLSLVYLNSRVDYNRLVSGIMFGLGS